MKKTVLTFGVLAGVIILVYTYATFLVLGDFDTMSQNDLMMAEVLGHLRYLLLLLAIVMAMVTYRKNTAGPIGYGTIFLVGFLVALVTSFFVGLLEYVYVGFINPEFFDQYAKLTLEGMQAKKASAAEIEAMLKQQEAFSWMRNPILCGLFYFGWTSVVGTVMALIAAFFLRRKKGASPIEGDPRMVNQPA